MANDPIAKLNRHIVAKMAASDYAVSGERKTLQKKLSLAASDDTVDQASIDSFPASDPPAWTCGIERDDARQPGNK